MRWGGTVIDLLTQTSFPLSGSMKHYLKHVPRQLLNFADDDNGDDDLCVVSNARLGSI